jgi:hypothetical protein
LDEEVEAEQRSGNTTRYNLESVRRNLKKPIGAGEACFELEAIDFSPEPDDANDGEGN